MPLVRLEVRNEYGLGDPELYKKSLRKEGPKAILDGVAVAGLVGILRQLGDLAEFAADVFHDLHEQITTTAGRSRKMMARVRKIESAIPSIEKVVKGQTSHIHFAYFAGSDWHTHIPHGQNLLLSSELPRFMMDSYEECRDPPRLFLLDKFDHSGTGACLKRYSDPSYFKRVWAASDTEGAKNDLKEKKVQKFKRKGTRFSVAENQQEIYSACHHSSENRKYDRGENFASLSTDGYSISLENENISSPELRLNHEISSRSTSFGSKTKESFVEETSYADPQMMPAELGYRLPNPNLHGNDSGLSVSALQDEPSTEDSDDVSQPGSLKEQSMPRSSVTWEEKTEIVKLTSPSSCNDILVDRVQVLQEGAIVENSDSLELNSELMDAEHAKLEALVHEDIVFHSVKTPEFLSGVNHFDEVTSETDNYVDAPITMDSESETEVECYTKMEIQAISNTNSLGMESETGEDQIISVQNPHTHDAEAPASLDSAQTQNGTGNFLHLNSLNGSEHVQSSYATKLVLNQDYLIPNNACEINAPDISEIKDHHECNDGGLSSKSGASCGLTVQPDEAASEPSILAHSLHTDAPSMPSVQLWTNGDLFGVEPSKPPELGAVNKDNKNYISNSRGSKTGFSSCTVKSQMFVNEPGPKSDGAFTVLDPASVDFSSEMDVDSECTLVSYVPQNSAGGQLSARRNLSVRMSTDVEIKQHSHMPVQPYSQSELLNNSHDSHSSSNDACLNKLELTRTNEINGAPPRDSYCIGSSAGPSQSTMGTSSSFSELERKFLSNTVQRKVLPTTNSGNTSMESTKPEGNSCLNDNKEEPNIVASQTLYKQNINEKATLVSEMKQTSSTQHYPEKGSPPLEYMKISFHPINGLENTRLKLDFSSGSLHENNEDFIFPSFQLLQGPVETLPEVCSESDDDTFCRSCPYSSEDLLSPCSYSNSEQWDKDESSEYFDHEFKDISRRFQSSTTSISRPMGSGQMDHADMHIPEAEIDKSKLPFHLGSMMELPGFNSVLSSIKQEGIYHSFPENLANAEVVPKDEAPPPLPPMQWRSSKPSITLEGYDNFKNNLGCLDGLQALRISPSQKKEQNSPINSCIGQAVLEHPKEEVVMSDIRLDQRKLNEQQRVTHRASHTEVDMREDMLQQIRNKKFSLRRTTTSTPRDIPHHPTTNAANANVNTILQKASAIRQAFVSSDDDNWSDA
ncbi:LOW QUALITY PROTEIN: SCAR-like protein 2 [Curcuma longa]|uniref:LOW QUALITY PROTEIN: SCAR-like protein 2 n=1 Tax=Curcuma longa TaxID=136217 RepID=UPI003D9EACEF